MSTPVRVRIGAGAGFADDRIAPAVALAESGAVDYLVFECLAERTIARETLTRLGAPDLGYNPHLEARMRAVLPPAMRNAVRIVTNMGGANPLAAAHTTRRLAGELGIDGLVCAAVTGDDVADLVRARPGLMLEGAARPVESLLSDMVSANAYLGAAPVMAALRSRAQVILTGRVADPSLFLAPAAHHLGWTEDDLDRLAAGTVAGHLLECSTQVTGGCFADPLRPEKHVPDLHDLGNPIAEIDRDGGVVITKLAGTGGRVDRRTCTEQLLYEVHDPARYITPDCVLNMTGIDLDDAGPDRVRVSGARAAPRTPTLKVVVGYRDGYIGEGQVGYAGIGAAERARLAAEVIRARLKAEGHHYDELRVDLIGMTSLHGPRAGQPDPYEVRLRIAGRTRDRAAAQAVGFETRAMHVNGPAGGGGGSNPVVREVLAVDSLLLPRALVRPEVHLVGEGRA